VVDTLVEGSTADVTDRAMILLEARYGSARKRASSCVTACRWRSTSGTRRAGSRRT